MTAEESLAEVFGHKPLIAGMILQLDRLVDEVERHRRNHKSIVLTNGCFDLLHLGHVRCLEEAAQQGDVLVVAVNSDAGVRRLKGSGRPVIHEHRRAVMLAALAFVDHVTIFEEDTPHNVIDKLRPDVLVKGGTTTEVIGRELVEAYGGRVHITTLTADVSTTRILQKMTT